MNWSWMWLDLSNPKTNARFACLILGDVVTAHKKIGLLAGSGALPHAVVAGALEQNYDVFVAVLKGFAETSDFSQNSKEFGLGEIGQLLKALKAQKCTHIIMAGNISRPDFKAIKPDFTGVKLLPKAIAAAKKGDDALLKFILTVFEKYGFVILAPQDVCNSSLMPHGSLGEISPNDDSFMDIDKAMEIALRIGSHDIGQGAVVCDGLVLAVEAQEGTDKMLTRVADLPTNIRGTSEQKMGVLAKRLKPEQESRVDLPTIGVETIRRVHKAGLAGIALEAGKAFVLDIESVKALADDLGVFVYGVKGTNA